MLLSELHKGDKANILKLDADKALRDRFASFGIMPGEDVIVKECSLARQTIEIEVGYTTVALRKEEADKIVVKIDTIEKRKKLPNRNISTPSKHF